jgi:hypothetical protein
MPWRSLAGVVCAVLASFGVASGDAAADVQIYPGTGSAYGITVGSDGAVYIADGGQNKVRVLSADGALIRTFPAGDNSCSCNVRDAAIKGSDLYLALSTVGVKHYSTTGVDSGDAAITTGGPTQSLAFTSAGDLIVSTETQFNPALNKVERYRTSDGALQATLAENGSGDGEVNRPLGVAVNPVDGHVLVAERSNARLQEFTDDGTFIRKGVEGRELFAVAVSPTGDIYVIEAASDGSEAIVRYDSGLNEVGRWPGVSISDLALNADGRYLYVNSDHDGIMRFDLKTPIPALTASRSEPQTGQRVSFDASATKVPFSHISKYEWDLDGDGVFETDTGVTPTAARTYGSPGHVDVRMRATAAESGVTGTATVPLEVGPSSAAVAATPNPALTGQVVTLDASGSVLPDSDPNAYAWDLDGNGSFETLTGATPTATTTFANRGEVTPRVRVTRPAGRVDEASVTVDVRPAPPEGAVGISINDGDQFTNDPQVQLHVVWPQFAQQVVLSNDGGFAHARTAQVDATIPWRLQESGPERLPKTIYGRFDSSTQTFQDDIILDQTRPRILTAEIRNTKARPVLTVRASDNLSGVGRMQVTSSRKRPGSWRKFKGKITLASRGPRWIRVRDRASNRSSWRLARPAKHRERL